MVFSSYIYTINLKLLVYNQFWKLNKIMFSIGTKLKKLWRSQQYLPPVQMTDLTPHESLRLHWLNRQNIVLFIIIIILANVPF